MCVNSPSSPASAAGSSLRSTSSAGRRSDTSSATRTVSRSSADAYARDFWMPPLSSETSETSLIETLLPGTRATATSCLEVFLASRSAPPASVSPVKTSAMAGPRRSRYFGSFDPSGRFSRTFPVSSRSRITGWSSQGWPRWGTMSRGACWALDTSGLPTSEPVSGSWPTPAARDWKDNGREISQHGRHTPGLAVAVIQRGRRQTPANSSLSPDWVEYLMGWPVGWTSPQPLAPARFPEWLRAFRCA